MFCITWLIHQKQQQTWLRILLDLSPISCTRSKIWKFQLFIFSISESWSINITSNEGSYSICMGEWENVISKMQMKTRFVNYIEQEIEIKMINYYWMFCILLGCGNSLYIYFVHPTFYVLEWCHDILYTWWIKSSEHCTFEKKASIHARINSSGPNFAYFLAYWKQLIHLWPSSCQDF